MRNLLDRHALLKELRGLIERSKNMTRIVQIVDNDDRRPIEQAIRMIELCVESNCAHCYELLKRMALMVCPVCGDVAQKVVRELGKPAHYSPCEHDDALADVIVKDPIVVPQFNAVLPHHEPPWSTGLPPDDITHYQLDMQDAPITQQTARPMVVISSHKYVPREGAPWRCGFGWNDGISCGYPREAHGPVQRADDEDRAEPKPEEPWGTIKRPFGGS